MRSRHAESTVNSEVLHASELLKWGRAFTDANPGIHHGAHQFGNVIDVFSIQ
jgi:hypothetical protein